jgi:hypothetical protein
VAIAICTANEKKHFVNDLILQHAVVRYFEPLAGVDVEVKEVTDTTEMRLGDGDDTRKLRRGPAIATVDRFRCAENNEIMGLSLRRDVRLSERCEFDAAAKLESWVASAGDSHMP